MGSVPPRWRYQPPPYLYPPPASGVGRVAVLVVVTVLAALVAPHARTLRGLVAGELARADHPPPLLGHRLPAMAPGRPGGRPSPWASEASPTAGAPRALPRSTARG